MDPTRKLTRRSVLKSGALMFGAAFASALSTQAVLAQQKASKQAMKYQDKPNGDQRCGNCMQFVAPNQCKVVEGTISPNGYCIAWAKKA